MIARQPRETLVQTIPGCRARRLHVPISVSYPRQAQLLLNLVGLHRCGWELYQNSVFDSCHWNKTLIAGRINGSFHGILAQKFLFVWNNFFLFFDEKYFIRIFYFIRICKILYVLFITGLLNNWVCNHFCARGIPLKVVVLSRVQLWFVSYFMSGQIKNISKKFLD